MADIAVHQALNIIHSANYQMSLNVKPDWITGDFEKDIKNANLLKLQSGVLVSIDQDGYIRLAKPTDNFVKVLILSAPGAFWDNMPTFGSYKLSVTGSNSVIETPQVEDTNIKPGDLLYASKTTEGLFTKTKDATSVKPVAIALTANSTTDKNVVVELI